MLIEIFDEINKYTFEDITRKLKDIPIGSDIDINISSYGGEILFTYSIIEALKPYIRHAKIYGFACSAAAILALSCNTVSIGSSSSIMIHSAWCDNLESNDPGIQRCNDLQLKIIRKRCPEFQTQLCNDIWLTAEQCLEMGLVDNI